MRNNFRQKIRFGLVGIANTLIDFAIFGVLTTLGFNAILVNYISTTAALIFSYVTNKKFTFQNTNSDIKKEGARFLLFTLAGLWILQPAIILCSVELAQRILGLRADMYVYWGAKLCAVVVTLVWNYVTYSRYVFKPAIKA